LVVVKVQEKDYLEEPRYCCQMLGHLLSLGLKLEEEDHLLVELKRLNLNQEMEHQAELFVTHLQVEL